VGDAVNRLPDVARRRLQGFAGRLERIRIEDLPMYVVRPAEPAHGEALERVRAAAAASGLDPAVAEARSGLTSYLERVYTDAQLRSTAFEWGGLGTTEDRIRITRSLGDATAAVVLWDTLDEPDRAELLGPWANLID
jgi:hypothetical protein